MSVSDAQLAIAGLVHIVSGVALIRDPRAFLQTVHPAIAFIENKTKLRSFAGNDQALALVGVLSFAIGIYYVLSVYTLDEKAKRNSTPGRLMIAASSYYVCTKTTNGSSLLALFGAFNMLGGLLMGLTVGFGDGIAVDLEKEAALEKERSQQARQAAEALQPRTAAGKSEEKRAEVGETSKKDE